MRKLIFALALLGVVLASCTSSDDAVSPDSDVISPDAGAISAEDHRTPDQVIERTIALHLSIRGDLATLQTLERATDRDVQYAFGECMHEFGLGYVMQPHHSFYDLDPDGFDVEVFGLDGLWFVPVSEQQAGFGSLGGLEYSRAAGIALEQARTTLELEPPARPQPGSMGTYNLCEARAHGIDYPSDFSARIEDLRSGLTAGIGKIINKVDGRSRYVACMADEGYEDLALSGPGDLFEAVSDSLYANSDGAPINGNPPSDSWLADREREREIARDDASCREPVINDVYEDVDQFLDAFEADNAAEIEELRYWINSKI